jgi:hypothetical protein
MLDTYPKDLGGVDKEKLAECIQACFECAQTCTACGIFQAERYQRELGG